MALFDADEPFQAHEAAAYRNRENRGRRAGVYANYDTTGQGALLFAKRIDFGLLYIHEPWVSYGARVDIDDVRDALGLEEDDAPTALPLSSGFVTDYDIDRSGNYVGAWVAVSVSYPDAIPVDAQIDIRHYFSFEAIALKDVPFDS